MKKLMSVLIISLVAASISQATPAIIKQKYQSIKRDDSRREMNTHYVGSLIATGLASSEMNLEIQKMDPAKIGEIGKNTITLIGDEDHPEEVYKFRKIRYYKVKLGDQEYFIMYIKAKRDGQKYEIIVDLNSPYSYCDRIITIYQDQKPYLLILWIDTLRVKEKDKI